MAHHTQQLAGWLTKGGRSRIDEQSQVRTRRYCNSKAAVLHFVTYDYGTRFLNCDVTTPTSTSQCKRSIDLLAGAADRAAPLGHALDSKTPELWRNGAVRSFLVRFTSLSP
jgi:hypothetical protein